MKRGEIEKLKFPFNTAGALEIYMPELGNWYRVTAKDFRSFNGQRRITEPTHTEHGNSDIPTVTNEYFGPVFQYGTNKIIEFTNSGSLEKNEIWDKNHKISGDRG